LPQIFQFSHFFFSKIGLHNINCNWAFYSRKTDSELVWTEEENISFGAKIEKGDYVKISCMAGSRQWFVKSFLYYF